MPSPPVRDPAAALVLLQLKTARRSGLAAKRRVAFSSRATDFDSARPLRPVLFTSAMRQAVAAIARFTVIGCHVLRNDRSWPFADVTGFRRSALRQKPPLPTSQASTQHRWRRPKNRQPCKVARQALRVLASDRHRSLRFTRYIGCAMIYPSMTIVNAMKFGS